MAKSALLIKMIDLIRQQPGITVTELAANTGRSERTVYRWLNELSVDLHTPAYFRDGGYYLANKPEPRAVDLTHEELLALRMSLKSSPFGEGSPVKAHAERAWRKIRDAAPLQSLLAARNMESNHQVNVTVPEPDVRQDMVDALENAVNSHRRLRVLYRSQKSNETRQYIIDPYALAFRRRSWYLLAFCRDYGRIIQMKLVRFVCVEDSGITFEPPADFSVDDYFRLSWEAWAGGDPVTVRVRFSARVAAMVAESKRHSTQVNFPQPDGSLIFEVEVAGIEEIAVWILSYGRDAEVLAPQSLRDHVTEHIRALYEAYGPPAKKDENPACALTESDSAGRYT